MVEWVNREKRIDFVFEIARQTLGKHLG